MSASKVAAPLVLGRYVLHEPIARGGMATIHLGRMTGAVGFTTTVAIKRLHPQLAGDPQFAAMLLDEARVASRVRHPNVVSTLDVVCEDGELFLVMEYVHGESLATLLGAATEKGRDRVTQRLSCGVLAGVLRGLHAAHEATSEQGEPLGIVHRDVSPQNVLVGADGVPRVLDFGVAKALGRLQTTRGGQLKGKLAYMAPEQVLARSVTRRTDVFAAAVVLWEALSGRRLFDAEADAAVLHQVLHMPIEPPSADDEVAAIVMRGLEREPAARYGSAIEMADALERAAGAVSPREIGSWVEATAADALASRAALVARVESRSLDPVSEIAAPPAAALAPELVDRAVPVTGISVSNAKPDPPARARSWGRIALVAGVVIGATTFGAISLRAGARGAGEASAELSGTSSADAPSPSVVEVGASEPPASLASSAPSAGQPHGPGPDASAPPVPRPPAARRGSTPPPAASSRPFYGRK